MKFATCLVALILMLMAVHLQAAVAVQVAKTVDFTQFKTFSWRQGTPAPNPATETMIRDAIQKELLAKGLTRVESGADLLVLTHARQASEMREDVDILGVQPLGKPVRCAKTWTSWVCSSAGPTNPSRAGSRGIRFARSRSEPWLSTCRTVIVG